MALKTTTLRVKAVQVNDSIMATIMQEEKHEFRCKLMHKTANSPHCNVKICPNCEAFVATDPNSNKCLCCGMRIKRVRNKSKDKIAEKFGDVAKQLLPYINEFKKQKSKESMLCVQFTFGLTIYNVNLKHFANFLSVSPDDHDVFLERVKKESTRIAFDVW